MMRSVQKRDTVCGEPNNVHTVATSRGWRMVLHANEKIAAAAFSSEDYTHQSDWLMGPSKVDMSLDSFIM